jgi:hypothetical protein
MNRRTRGERQTFAITLRALPTTNIAATNFAAIENRRR